MSCLCRFKLFSLVLLVSQLVIVSDLHATCRGPLSEPSKSAGIESRVESLKSHEGFTSLRKVNFYLGQKHLNHQQLVAFVNSLIAFNQTIPAGIVALAARLTDKIFAVSPLVAHEIAAKVLDPAIDEYGKRDPTAHYVLLVEFGRALGLKEVEFAADEKAPISALEMGDFMKSGYRTRRIAYGLGVHVASELTSEAEYTSWVESFSPQRYSGLTPKSKGRFYLEIHAQLEDGHGSNAVKAVQEYLRLFPEETNLVWQGAEDYLSNYKRMFDGVYDHLLTLE